MVERENEIGIESGPNSGITPHATHVVVWSYSGGWPRFEWNAATRLGQDRIGALLPAVVYHVSSAGNLLAAGR